MKWMAAAVLIPFIASTAAAGQYQNKYRVVSGDNLWTIAQLENTTVYELRRLNNISGDLIFPGQVLLLPEKNGYRIVPGDTLWELAKRHKTSVSRIMKANSLRSSTIYAGQVLDIPSSGEIASNSPEITEEGYYWLVRAISAEARGEPLDGQIAVGAVILNRVKSGLFPNDIKSVVFQKINRVFQFSPVGDGSIYNNPVPTAYEAARRALRGEDPTKGALYFYNPELTSSKNWIKSRPVSLRVENHVFAW